MGKLRDALLGPPIEARPRPRHLTAQLAPFVVPDRGLQTDRVMAWNIPAVAQALQVIAGTVGTFPLTDYNISTRQSEQPPLFVQLDPDEPSSVTMTRVMEDLVLFPDAYLLVLRRYSDTGFPAALRYVPHEHVTPPGQWSTYDRAQHWTVGHVPAADGWKVYDRPVPAGDVIRIRSHWPGLLATGASVMATSRMLEAASAKFAVMDQPTGILRNTGADLPDPDVAELLDKWDSAASTRTTRYLNRVLEYDPTGFNADDVDLSGQMEHNVAQIARLVNLPTRHLNAPTNSSLTYSTLEGQRRELWDLSLRPYVTAVQDRFSMDDVSPRGHQVRFDPDAYVQGSTKERWDAYKVAIAAKFLTIDEVRDRENMPPIDESDTPDDPIETLEQLEQLATLEPVPAPEVDADA